MSNNKRIYAYGNPPDAQQTKVIRISQPSSKPNISKILSTVPSQNAFRFCAADGVYTKVSATSLEDFAKKLDGIDAISLQFHYPRGDFQIWIKDTLGDSELAEQNVFHRARFTRRKA